MLEGQEKFVQLSFPYLRINTGNYFKKNFKYKINFKFESVFPNESPECSLPPLPVPVQILLFPWFLKAVG